MYGTTRWASLLGRSRVMVDETKKEEKDVADEGERFLACVRHNFENKRKGK